MIAFEDVTLVAPPGTRILAGAELRVRPGEIYAFTGDRRIPLSLVAESILGFVKTEAGSITVCGHRPGTHPAEVRRQVTAIRWPSGLEPRLTVRANVRLLIRLAGHTVHEEDAIDAALRESDLPDRCFDRPGTDLPAFGQRAVWLAIARLRATPVVLCDDPTAASSDRDATSFARLVRELAATGPAVLVTTADAAFARAVADRGAVLDQGATMLEWSRRELPPAGVAGYHLGIRDGA
jgi:ABC-2 type transport system ATP-binding protein